MLVQFRKNKPNYKAWLAVKIGEDWAVMGRLEAHGHAGLHCHLQCPDSGIFLGPIGLDNMVSIPNRKDHHRRPNEVLSERIAWERALKFFRAHAAAGTGLLGL